MNAVVLARSFYLAVHFYNQESRETWDSSLKGSDMRLSTWYNLPLGLIVLLPYIIFSCSCAIYKWNYIACTVYFLSYLFYSL